MAQPTACRFLLIAFLCIVLYVNRISPRSVRDTGSTSLTNEAAQNNTNSNIACTDANCTVTPANNGSSSDKTTSNLPTTDVDMLPSTTRAVLTTVSEMKRDDTSLTSTISTTTTLISTSTIQTEKTNTATVTVSKEETAKSETSTAGQTNTVIMATNDNTEVTTQVTTTTAKSGHGLLDLFKKHEYVSTIVVPIVAGLIGAGLLTAIFCGIKKCRNKQQKRQRFRLLKPHDKSPNDNMNLLADSSEDEF